MKKIFMVFIPLFILLVSGCGRNMAPGPAENTATPTFTETVDRFKERAGPRADS